MEIIYKNLQENEISRELFRHFVRHQTVVKCRRKENGKWIIKDDPFIDDWSEADYKFLVSCLRNTAATGGLVYAAFCEGVLKGFVSVEPKLFGGNHRYLDLSSIHVSEDMRGKGVGTALFRAAKEWQRHMEQKSCTSQPIQPLKARHSITKWAVQRRLSTISLM